MKFLFILYYNLLINIFFILDYNFICKWKENIVCFIWDKFDNELEIWVLNVLRIVSLIVGDIF